MRIHKTFKGFAAVAVFGAVVLTGIAQIAAAQPPAAAPAKKYKDAGEFDLYNNAVKETAPAKKLELLNQWADKYPESDFKDERLQLYSMVNDPNDPKVMQAALGRILDLGTAALAKDPKSLAALYLISVSYPKLAVPTADQQANAKKGARQLLDNLDAIKPAAMSDADWQKNRGALEAAAKTTLFLVAARPGLDAQAAKTWPAAEAAFTSLLKEYPDSGQAAYWLGSSMISQKVPEKYPQALFEIARAVSLPPATVTVAEGGLADPNRGAVDKYLAKTYTSYHGSDEGLKELKDLALKSPFPPAGFKLLSASEIIALKEEEFRKTNPQLALWMSIKRQLLDTGGDAYFDSQVKGAAIPKLKGTVVAAKPPVRSKELLVALSDDKTAEVTLKLVDAKGADAPLAGKPEIGSVIQWEGVPSAFTKEPFLLTMDTEKAKIEGLNVVKVAPAPVHKKAGAKKK